MDTKDKRDNNRGVSSRTTLIALTIVLLAAGAFFFFGSDKKAPPPVSPAQVQKFETLAQETKTFKNGTRVSIVSGKCGNKVGLSVLWAIGTEHDPEEKSGVAYLNGHLLREKLGLKDASTLPVGGSFISFHTALSPADLKDSLTSWSSLASEWSVSEESLQAAKDAVLAEIERRHGGDPVATARGYALESAHSSRAEAHLGGIAEQVQSITTEEATQYFKTMYTGNNLIVSIHGQVDQAQALELAKQTYGALDAGPKGLLSKYGHSTVRGTLVMGSEPTAVALSVAAPNHDAPSYPGFLALTARILQGKHDWQASYDPLNRPEALVLTRTFAPGQRPEPIADQMRADLTKLVEPEVTTADAELALEEFGVFLGENSLDIATCPDQAVARSLATAHRLHRGINTSELLTRARDLDEDGLQGARQSFEAKATAAVAAGGEIR